MRGLLLAALVGIASPAGAITFTYELTGSSLDYCHVSDAWDTSRRLCTGKEAAQHQPPGGFTYDGKIWIDGDALGITSMANVDFGQSFKDWEMNAALRFENPILQPGQDNGFGLKTDAAGNVTEFYFGLNTGAYDYGYGSTETGFSNTGRGLAWMVLPDPLGADPVNNPIKALYHWSGTAGTMTQVPAPVPVPATIPLLLSGVAALAFVARRRRAV